MVLNCLIEFDGNQDGVYFSGQHVTGKVTFETDTIKKTEGMELKVFGRCETRFTHGMGDSKRTYRGNEVFFSTETYLVTPPPGETSLDITPGTHRYIFSCPLPTNCPTSFETTTYGHIRYVVEVTLKRSWKFNQNFVKGFTVIKSLDIMDPLFRTPITAKDEKHFGWGPFKSDQLMMQMSLQTTAFVPGQNIPVSLFIDNQSDVDVKEVTVELILTVLYRAHSTVTTTKESLAISILKGDPVLRYTKKKFNYYLPVPPTPPSDTIYSTLMNISYDLHVKAIPKGPHFKKSINAPVTIGSIVTSSNKSIRPVYFKEALYMPEAILAAMNEYSEKKFKPKYAVYDFIEKTPEVKSEKCEKK